MLRTILISALLCVVVTTGCMTQEEWRRFWDRGDRGSQPEPSPRIISKSKATRGTIGELVTVDGLRLLQVRGFGLVVDLPGSGGGDGPEPVKKYLIKEMRRWQKPSDPDISAPELLDARDTAMVEVTGLIPAAARKGTPFDAVVRALGTQTKSLSGGRLVLCNLKVFAESMDAVLGGKTIATARGPVFISPVGLRQEIPDEIDLRTGLVLGGGSVKRPRKVRLVLNTPSPSDARRIVDRVNGRFAVGDPVAVARDHAAVDLTIPRAYRDRRRLFLEHVLHTTMNADSAALRRRSRDLADEIAHPDAEFESIGVAWEAIGRIVLPEIQNLYYHALPAANFYAGRAGMRLGDKAGMEAVAKHAMDPDSPFREAAIEELGYARSMHGAGEYLRELLNDAETPVRLRAYKTLRRRPHPAIVSKVLYTDNLILDIVESSGPYLIYVHRSRAPRIAIFGSHLRCKPPAMYPASRRDDRFRHMQISAQPGDDHLTVIFKNKRWGRTSPALPAPLEVAELIRYLGGTPDRDEEDQPRSLGVPYDEIVEILHAFCEVGTIPARLLQEDLTGADETRLEALPERRESEY